LHKSHFKYQKREINHIIAIYCWRQIHVDHYLHQDKGSSGISISSARHAAVIICILPAKMFPKPSSCPVVCRKILLAKQLQNKRGSGKFTKPLFLLT